MTLLGGCCCGPEGEARCALCSSPLPDTLLVFVNGVTYPGADSHSLNPNGVFQIERLSTTSCQWWQQTIAGTLPEEYRNVLFTIRRNAFLSLIYFEVSVLLKKDPPGPFALGGEKGALFQESFPVINNSQVPCASMLPLGVPFESHYTAGIDNDFMDGATGSATVVKP